MYVFCFEHPGIWLGAYTIVVASSPEEARIQLMGHLEQEYPTLYQQALKEPENVTIMRTLSFNAPSTYVVFSGDY